jgi:GTP:adenosylcobinamide-phosphate guanylyltransferase
MSYKQIKKIVTLSSDINKLQDSITDSLDPLLKKAHLDSQIITSIVLTQGTINQVKHLLGRIPIGYNIVNQYAQADIWNAQKSDNNFIYLMTSSNCTVDFEVF